MKKTTGGERKKGYRLRRIWMEMIEVKKNIVIVVTCQGKLLLGRRW